MTQAAGETSDILIVGGGLVGAAMALAAAQTGRQVRVLERASAQTVYQPRNDGRVSAISEASTRVLKHIGVWDGLRDQVEPIRDIRVADKGSRAHVHFDHRAIGDKPFGYMTPNYILRQALQEAMERQPGVTIDYDAATEAVETNAHRARVTLADGRTYQAPLLIVADGRQSSLRGMLGIGARRFEYDQTAMVCTIRHSLPHDGLAVELFLPSGPLAVLPMTGQRSAIVWTETTERAQGITALDDAAFTAAVAQAMGGYLGEIELEGTRYAYPLYLVQADRYMAPRAALIGDAAHAIHPIAGQGVNLGYRDVAVLAELLEEAQSLGLDPGSAGLLERYQRWRHFDAVSMIATTDLINRLFSNNLMPMKLARRAGLSLFNRIRPVKEWFMLGAMGLKGDLPRMLRDDPSGGLLPAPRRAA